MFLNNITFLLKNWFKLCYKWYGGTYHLNIFPLFLFFIVFTLVYSFPSYNTILFSPTKINLLYSLGLSLIFLIRFLPDSASWVFVLLNCFFFGIRIHMLSFFAKVLVQKWCFLVDHSLFPWLNLMVTLHGKAVSSFQFFTF